MPQRRRSVDHHAATINSNSSPSAPLTGGGGGWASRPSPNSPNSLSGTNTPPSSKYYHVVDKAMEMIRLVPTRGEADERDEEDKEEGQNKRHEKGNHDHRSRSGTMSDKRMAMPLRKESNDGSLSSSPPAMSFCEAALDVDLIPPQRALSVDQPAFDADDMKKKNEESSLMTTMDDDLLPSRRARPMGTTSSTEQHHDER